MVRLARFSHLREMRCWHAKVAKGQRRQHANHLTDLSCSRASLDLVVNSALAHGGSKLLQLYATSRASCSQRSTPIPVNYTVDYTAIVSFSYGHPRCVTTVRYAKCYRHVSKETGSRRHGGRVSRWKHQRSLKPEKSKVNSYASGTALQPDDSPLWMALDLAQKLSMRCHYSTFNLDVYYKNETLSSDCCHRHQVGHGFEKVCNAVLLYLDLTVYNTVSPLPLGNDDYAFPWNSASSLCLFCPMLGLLFPMPVQSRINAFQVSLPSAVGHIKFINKW